MQRMSVFQCVWESDLSRWRVTGTQKGWDCAAGLWEVTLSLAVSTSGLWSSTRHLHPIQWSGSYLLSMMQFCHVLYSSSWTEQIAQQGYVMHLHIYGGKQSSWGQKWISKRKLQRANDLLQTLSALLLILGFHSLGLSMGTCVQDLEREMKMPASWQYLFLTAYWRNTTLTYICNPPQCQHGNSLLWKQTLRLAVAESRHYHSLPCNCRVAKNILYWSLQILLHSYSCLQPPTCYVQLIHEFSTEIFDWWTLWIVSQTFNLW